MATVNTSAVRPNQPARQIIASFDDYADAERAVDALSDSGFPVNRVAIVGRDLEYVEQVVGRLTAGGAALRGAASGALVGALIGWFFGIVDWINPLTASLLLALYGAVFGAVVGALVGVVGHALQRGRRDFQAVSSLVPKSYDVVADVEVVDQALRLLSTVNKPKE